MSEDVSGRKKNWSEYPFRDVSVDNLQLPDSLLSKEKLLELKHPEQFEIPHFRLCALPAGEFIMGGTEMEREKPLHKVRVNSFYMAEFPVTQELYNAIMNKNRSDFQGIQHPVERVNWYAAVDFCITLNEKLGIESPYVKTANKKYEWNRKRSGFRLPTEAEWEYAAKAGDDDLDFSGSNRLRQVAWFEGNNGYSTMRVGKKFPNAWGLYDMSGNVWEWCFDSYTRYDEKYTENPTVEVDDSRVLRGGSWIDTPRRCRTSSRSGNEARRGWYDYGLRLAFGF